jgi:hypothetical protein
MVQGPWFKVYGPCLRQGIRPYGLRQACTDHGPRTTDHGSRLTAHGSRTMAHGSRLTDHSFKAAQVWPDRANGWWIGRTDAKGELPIVRLGIDYLVK